MASIRPEVKRSIAWLKPSVSTISAPFLRAMSDRLLVSDCPAFLPFKSAKLLISLLFSPTINTALETIYGSEKSYLTLRSSVIDTSLKITSKRLASIPAKMPSHCVSKNSGSTPRRLETSSAISTSKPVSLPSAS
ncbi:hypothetical protein D3C81_1469390 [compost metagenome]